MSDDRLPALPDIEYDPTYDDDATYRRLRHRTAQSLYRKSDKGRRTQAAYRAQRVAEGRCIVCGHPRGPGRGEVTCNYCLDCKSIANAKATIAVLEDKLAELKAATPEERRALAVPGYVPVFKPDADNYAGFARGDADGGG